MRSALGRSLKRNVRMGRKRKRSELHLRRRYSLQLLKRSRYRSDLQSPSGGRIRILILRQETASHDLQRSQLLRVILEFRRSDECGWVPDVLIPNPQILQEEKVNVFYKQYIILLATRQHLIFIKLSKILMAIKSKPSSLFIIILILSLLSIIYTQNTILSYLSDYEEEERQDFLEMTISVHSSQPSLQQAIAEAK